MKVCLEIEIDHKQDFLNKSFNISDERIVFLQRYLEELFEKHEKITTAIEEILLNNELGDSEKIYMIYQLGFNQGRNDLFLKLIENLVSRYVR